MLGLSSAMMSRLHSSIPLWNLWFMFPHNLSTLKENDCAAGALIWDLATDNWERVQVSEKPRRVNHAGIKMGDLLWCPKLWRLWAEDLGKRRDQSWKWEGSCSTHVHQQGRLVHSADEVERSLGQQFTWERRILHSITELEPNTLWTSY